jgi:hypothetical protein
MNNAEKPQLTIQRVMWRLIGWLYTKCYYCKDGRLLKIDTYHYKPKMDIDIYRCNKCGNRTGINAT